MLIDRELIQSALEKLSDQTPDLIANLLHLERYDSHTRKALCPFHQEDTPSFCYDSKRHRFYCFGCRTSCDLVTAFMEGEGLTFVQAVQRIFELADIRYTFSEAGVKTRHAYRYPHPESPENDRSRMIEYLGMRGISESTIQSADLAADPEGNIAFYYYDTNDVLTMVKYRPARKIPHGEAKCWCQRDADTTPLLFNMHNCNPLEPLLICEGEADCLSAIEAGWKNSVSVPLGAGNLHWIEENFDWLNQFQSIILAGDNDDAGRKMNAEASRRLESWRTKILQHPCYLNKDGRQIPINDLNEILYRLGPSAVLDAINGAKEADIPDIIDYADVQDVNMDEIDGITFGLKPIDNSLLRLYDGSVTVITGSNGCVDAKTEYFNGTRWKPISDYVPTDKVLQYWPDGTTGLTKPLAYHKYPCDQFVRIRTETGVDQCISLEHNLVYTPGRGIGKIFKTSVPDFIARCDNSKQSFCGKFITTFERNNGGYKLDEDVVRLLIAAIVRGEILSFGRHKHCRCMLRDRTGRLLPDLIHVLESNGLKHELRPTATGGQKLYFEMPLRTETFPKQLYLFSPEQGKRIMDLALLYGFGQNLQNRFARRENADFLQFIFAANGKRSTIDYDPGNEQKPWVLTFYESWPLSGFKNYEKPYAFVPSEDGFKYCFTVPSGMLVLRRNGRINVTGNSGKSSITSQLVCQAADQGKASFVFSREMPNGLSRSWCDYIFAGPRCVQETATKSGATIYRVDSAVKRQLSDFYKGRIFLYKDKGSSQDDAIFETAREAIRRYGIELIVLDNIMCINLSGKKDDENQKQQEFMTKLIDFAVDYRVAVVLVCHPRKGQVWGRLDKWSIKGSSSILDLAHRGLALYRVRDQDREPQYNPRTGALVSEGLRGDVIVDVLKDRFGSSEGKSFSLNYDVPSRRFFTSPAEYDYHYLWDRTQYTDSLPYPVKDETSEVF